MIETAVRRGASAGAPLLCPQCNRQVRDPGLCVTCWDHAIDTPPTPPHGTVSNYTGGRCRCDDCRDAMNAWKREYKRRRRAERAVDNIRARI